MYVTYGYWIRVSFAPILSYYSNTNHYFSHKILIINNNKYITIDNKYLNLYNNNNIDYKKII